MLTFNNFLFFFKCVAGTEVRRLMNKAFKTKLVLHQQQVCNDVVLNSCLATSEGTLEKISFYLTLNKKKSHC